MNETTMYKREEITIWLHNEIKFGNWCSTRSPKRYQISFRFEEDKVKFILRWV